MQVKVLQFKNPFKSFDASIHEHQKISALDKGDTKEENKSYSFSSVNNSFEKDLQMTDRDWNNKEEADFPLKYQESDKRMYVINEHLYN